MFGFNTLRGMYHYGTHKDIWTKMKPLAQSSLFNISFPVQKADYQEFAEFMLSLWQKMSTHPDTAHIYNNETMQAAFYQFVFVEENIDANDMCDYFYTSLMDKMNQDTLTNA